MPFDPNNPYGTTSPTPGQTFSPFQYAYNTRSKQDNKAAEVYRALGHSNANVLGTFGLPAQKLGINNLYQMLLNQGRMDPRIMALQQSQIARGTQQAQTGAQGMLAQKGFGKSGLGAALQGAIGQAGQNQQADLRYRDISDSYAHNQQNLGLLQQLVTQPSLDYAAIGQGSTLKTKEQAEQEKKNKQIELIAKIFGGIL